ncbi:MAG TPA: universal stress protein [Leptolyngbyaceae cyanobacterium M65_K2018_010]|nr:universal stress protein [Leptolyngbyaceae cyanobacterium M65_K2018_010]
MGVELTYNSLSTLTRELTPSVFESVLIALDNSPLDQRIMAVAQGLNFAPGAKIVFTHVLPYPEDAAEQDVSRPLPVEHDLPQVQIEQYLSAWARQLSQIAPVIEVVQGNADVEIVRLANIHQVSLIILGSRGLTGVDRILAGSVSSQVVEEAPCTVMVVKPG